MANCDEEPILTVRFRASTAKGFFGRAMLIEGQVDVPGGTPEQVRSFARDRLREVFAQKVRLEIQFDHWVPLD